MATLALITAALALAAPPPKPVAYTGRITLWIGDKFEHFRPDGGDVATIVVPDQPPYGLKVMADRKAYVAVDRNAAKPAVVPAGGELYGKLVITPLDANGQPFTLDGYVAQYTNLTVDGSRVYFSGGKGDEVTEDHVKSPRPFALDLTTKKVTPLTLPEKHTLLAVAQDGQTFLTSRIETDNNTYSRRTFLVPANGKPTEVLKENVFPSQMGFSPDGSKVLIMSIEYTDVQPNGNGGMRVGGSKPREYVVLDVATKATKPLRNLPTDGYLSGWAWSPDGTQVAYTWYDPRVAAGQAVAVPAPGGGIMRMMEYEYKVFVADAEGGSTKEIYKTKGTTIRTFMWK